MSKFRDTKSYITNKINHSKKINFTEMKGAKRKVKYYIMLSFCETFMTLTLFCYSIEGKVGYCVGERVRLF